MTRAFALQDFAQRMLGTRGHEHVTGVNGRIRVIRVTDGDGRSWYCKQTVFPPQWRSEVRAYRRWFVSLAGEVPELRAVQRAERLLIVSALPGQTVIGPGDRETHRAAGGLLRRIHDAWPGHTETAANREAMIERLAHEYWRQEVDFSVAEVTFVREHMRALGTLPLMDFVTCHGDYGPHNWLVDDDGAVRAIDFGESKWNPPAFDVARMCLQPWWDTPSLAAAFFEGYGRELTDLEQEYLRHQIVRSVVTAIRWAHRHGEQAIEARSRARLAALMDGYVVQLRETSEPARILRSVVRLGNGLGRR